jgi:N-acetylglucosamine-6-phosphate deacetylase
MLSRTRVCVSGFHKAGESGLVWQSFVLGACHKKRACSCLEKFGGRLGEYTYNNQSFDQPSCVNSKPTVKFGNWLGLSKQTRHREFRGGLMPLIARDYHDGRWISVEIDDRLVASVEHRDGTDAPSPVDFWVAPGFWDIQTNGRWGRSFSSPDIDVRMVAEIVRVQSLLGTARLCPTLITAPVESTLHGLRTIAATCDAHPDVAARIVGIHLEGPFLSEVDGYRGAHPVSAIRDPDWELFLKFQEASGGRVVLMTLAPERSGAIELIERLTAAGVAVALGHTAADGPTIAAAVTAGARLSTHLGNGIASPLARHPNPIWKQAAEDALTASFIADGHHVDLDTLRVLARAKGPDRTVLVSDASPLAGLPPGVYGDWAVDPSGKIVVAGTPYLAGSNQDLSTGLENLAEATNWTLVELINTVTRNPARVLGKPEPIMEPGQPANLVLFQRVEPNRLAIRRVCVDGAWEEITAG